MVGLSNALFVSANSRQKVDFKSFMPYEYAQKPSRKMTQAEKIEALFKNIGSKHE